MKYPKPKQTSLLLLAFITLLWTAGCAPPFSRQALDQVDRGITFRDLQRDPDRYKGKSVMLGGVIITSKNSKEGTVIEVLQRPMGRRGRPLDTDSSEGRFLIESDEFLDAAVYHSGRMITIIGDVVGQTEQKLGEMQYRYPVIKSRELEMWEPSARPQVHFGVGIGVYRGF